MEKLKQDIDSEITAKEQPAKTPTDVDPGAAVEVQHGSTSPMMQIQGELKANGLEIQNYQQREKKIESDITAYQARLNLTPETEQQLADISRGYDESKTNYNSLLQKQNQSQLATSLEQRQQGEQLSIIDPPTLPDKPSAPNHLLVSLAGLALGIVLGLGLCAFIELTDVRVRQEEDLAGLVPARVLVGIPHLSVPGEDRLAT